MKRYLGLALITLFLSIGLSGCIIGVTEDGGFGSQGGGSIAVLYRVELSGNAFVYSVQWFEGGRTQTENISSNWSRTVRANPGDPIYITADASASGGTVRISYEATRNGQVVARSLLNCQQAPCTNFVLQDSLPN